MEPSPIVCFKCERKFVPHSDQEMEWAALDALVDSKDIVWHIWRRPYREAVESRIFVCGDCGCDNHADKIRLVLVKKARPVETDLRSLQEEFDLDAGAGIRRVSDGTTKREVEKRKKGSTKAKERK